MKQNPTTTTIEEYELSTREATLMGEYDLAIRDLEKQKQGALNMILRAQGLTGKWTLIDKKLIKVKEPKE